MQKSTTLYLGEQRLSLRLPFDLWSKLAKYTITTKEPGNTLMINLLIIYFRTEDLAAIHQKLLLAKTDPEISKSANALVVDLLTEYFQFNPV